MERRLSQALGRLQLKGDGREGGEGGEGGADGATQGALKAGSRSGSGSGGGCAVQWVWGSTMYHRDDLPFLPDELPDVYTQFRKVGTTHWVDDGAHSS